MNQIIGYADNKIEIVESTDSYKNVGIVFPGQSYGLSTPCLYYLYPLFEKYQFHYVGLDLCYGNIPEYIKAEVLQKKEWIEKDSETIGKYLNAERFGNNKKRLFVGKSLGTSQIYACITQGLITNKDIVILQTPIIEYEEIQNVLIKNKIKSLIVYGTRDNTIVKKKFKRIKTKENVQVLEIENAGHVYEEDLNVDKAIENLRTVMTGIDKFLGSI